MPLHITSDAKSVDKKPSKPVKVYPKTKDELRKFIKDEVNRQGPDADLNHIDVSKITDMSGLFYCPGSIEGPGLDVRNIKINKWNVSNVTNMSGMFAGCWYFVGDISSWDVSKVTDMSFMFKYCSHFVGDLSKWDVSKVVDMSSMFRGCTLSMATCLVGTLVV